MSERREMATSFGAEASAYESGRPSYPAEAVAWLLADDPAVVVDVGAGTGKLTRSLGGSDRVVIAVDPDPAMLAMLRQASPDVTTHVGTAEALPLPDHSADLVVLGQAWHWVDPVAASAEIGRVLRPGGALGLVWNIRDDTTPWVARMSEIMHHSAGERMVIDDHVVVGAPLGDLEHVTFDWVRPMERDTLLDMARSRSYVITADDPTRARIEHELGELFDSLVELANDGMIHLPYSTHVFRARR